METTQTQAVKVYFEVTNACNFDCDFCPSGGSTRRRGPMDFALLQKGIDEIAAGRLADTVGFHILGEPLLYPRIYDAIAYAKSKGLRTEINTNGSLLTPERLAQLMAAGLDDLAISVQVLGAREHSCRGTTMPFEEYYRRVLDAVRFTQAGASRMDVCLCFMNTATIKYFDIDQFLRLNRNPRTVRARLVGFLLDLYAVIGKPAERQEVERAVGRLNLEHPRLLRLDKRLAVYAQPFADWGNAFTSRKVFPARLGYCNYGMKNIGVLNDGRVTICCADYDGKTALGDLNREGLGDILASAPACAIRAGFDKARLVHPYCQRCVGSPSPAKAAFKGLASIYLFRWLKFQPAQIGEIELLKPPAPLRLGWRERTLRLPALVRAEEVGKA